MEISEAHKLHIGVILRNLERDLIAFEKDAGKEAFPARLTVYIDRIPPVAEIFELVASMRREIENVADEFELPPYAESTIRAFLGRLHVRVVSIGELRPCALRAAGELEPELAKYIEAKADRLETLLRRLIALLEEQARKNRA
ncbi:MAG: hypothetical protein IRZ19_10315 [Pyrinomonas methylaliphatogenes]|nr:hypothetical protein [Pyrinomonas methylaliphatogenes]